MTADLLAIGRGAYPTGGALLASAARTADVDTDNVGTTGAAGLIVVIDVTAKTSTPSVIFTVQGYDKVSDSYYDILASAAVTDVGTTVLQVHPALTEATNEKASALVPEVFRVDANHADTNSITYSVAAYLTP